MYTITNRRNESRIMPYHQSPAPMDLRQVDTRHIKGLPTSKRKNLTLSTDIRNRVLSNFGIGFEIEKNTFHRGAVKASPILKGYEEDCSCGYEAITHILPLLDASTWRTELFEHVRDLEKIIDSNYSPADYRCGTHTTISIEGMTGAEIREAIRPFMGLFYSIFRYRLSNKYCGYDLQMNGENVGGYCSRYRTTLAKYRCLEIRLPHAMTSTKDLMFLYELTYIMTDTAVNKPNTSFNAFLNKCKKTLMFWFGDADKVEDILTVAKSMNRFLRKSKIDSIAKPFLIGDIPSEHRNRNTLDRSGDSSITDMFDRSCR